VDAIEAGTPFTSKEELRSVKLIAAEGLEADVYGLARLRHADVDAVIHSDINHIHLFIATSDIHLEHKLHMTRDQAVKTALELIDYAHSHGLIVEFSAEDATRTDLEYLKHFYHEVDQAGVTRINIPDTLGIMTPHAMHTLVKALTSEITTPISVHCHNDFGMAVANSIAGLQAGADQVHVAVNGLGERAGNASLEEIVMALTVLHDTQTNIVPDLIYQTSQLVSRLTGVPVQPNKAIVGENAFTHEAGIHTHGVTSHPLTYEPISPELVGVHRRFSAGKLSGTRGIQTFLEDMGLNPTPTHVQEVFTRVKTLGDKGKTITDTDVYIIAEAVMGLPLKRSITLEELTVMTGNRITPTATVRIKLDSEPFTEAAIGIGPVDAAINAIHKAIRQVTDIELDHYQVKAITGGTDALVEVAVNLKKGEKKISSMGAHGDIVMASVEAMLSGMNVLMAHTNNNQNVGEE
jgi:isopropylmalate/homocitrate/citramalate synthase